MESYSNMEFRKLIMDVDSSNPNIKITYIGTAEYRSNLNKKGYYSVSDTAEPIWKIKKIVDTKNGLLKNTETFFPVGDSKASFSRDDRHILTYR